MRARKTLDGVASIVVVAVTMVNAPDKVDTLTVTLANCRLEKERVQHTRIPDTSQITADKKLNASAAFQ